jgi:hypothetical protein
MGWGRYWSRAIPAMIVGCLLSGCASEFVNVSPAPPASFTRLGKAHGSACGSLGILATAYYVVPMGVNHRVERAYQNALASVPGATALVDVDYQENWYWWLIGTMRCVTVEGEAIK